MKPISLAASLAALLLPLSVSANQAPLTPPDAKPGECYARVVVPAQYEEVEEKVLVKEPSEEITIIPASFAQEEKAVEVVPETTKLTPVPATFKEVKKEIITRKARRVWVSSLGKKAHPVNPMIVKMVAASGVALDEVAPDTCLKEYYTPERYVSVTEDVMVKSEQNETTVIPPQFEEFNKTVVTKPSYSKLTVVPAQYDESEERVMVTPEKTVWKKGSNPAQQVDGATGDIMCLVKIPATYKTVKKSVLVSPATTQSETVPEETVTLKAKKLLADAKTEVRILPAAYVSVKKEVLEQNATFTWVPSSQKQEAPWRATGHQICLKEEPAKTKTITTYVVETPARVERESVPPVEKVVKVQTLVADAKAQKQPVEPVYERVVRKKEVAKGQVEWRRILCKTNMTKEIITKLQKALNERGYDAGEPDGLLGRGTQKALEKFQKENSLATGGITYETLDALGVAL